MAKKVFGIDVKDLVPVGKGVEGTVYRTPDNKALKVYKSISICNSKYKILRKYKDNKHFPDVYECKGYYMLREYIDGTPLREYIMEHGLSETLALNLVNMAEDFYNIRNIKLDGLNKHVLVLKDESVKIIDPRKRYYRFYNSLLSSLEKVGVYDKFVRILYREKPELAAKWLDYKTLKSLEPDSKNESSEAVQSQIDVSTSQEKNNEEEFIEVNDSTLENNNFIEELCENITSEIEKTEEIVGQSAEADFITVDPIEIELETIEPIEIELEAIKSIETEFETIEPTELELETVELVEIELETHEPTGGELETIEPVDEIHEEENLELPPTNIQTELEEEELEIVDSKRLKDIVINKINTTNHPGSQEEVVFKKGRTNYRFKILGKNCKNNVKLNLSANIKNEFHLK